MVLGDSLIKELNMIEPYNDENLQAASYDLSVGSFDRNIDGWLMPKESMLVSTKEYFRLPKNIAAFVKTRSSLARMGVTVDVGGWVDPGFRGNLTLLISNLGRDPVDLSKIDRFAQIIFLEVAGVSEAYNGNYQDSNGLKRSVLDEGKVSNS